VSDAIAALARLLPDVEERPSQFHGEPALWIDGREFLHAHGNEVVEIRLTRALIRELDEPRAPARGRYSDWVIVRAEHAGLVHDLAQRALEANRR
jgi:Family of unknown function (DUF5519)